VRDYKKGKGSRGLHSYFWVLLTRRRRRPEATRAEGGRERAAGRVVKGGELGCRFRVPIAIEIRIVRTPLLYVVLPVLVRKYFQERRGQERVGGYTHTSADQEERRSPEETRAEGGREGGREGHGCGAGGERGRARLSFSSPHRN
jgi:hypothetical protein